MASDTAPSAPAPQGAPDPAAIAAVRTHAEQAHTHLKALSDGLDQLGAPPSIVKATDEMTDAVGQISDQLNGKPPPEPAGGKPDTMASATDSMQNDLKASRGGS